MTLYFSRAIETLGPSLIEGIGVVVYVTIAGFLGAMIVGMALAIGSISKNKVIKTIISFILNIVRGTPLLVQFFYIYYVFPMFINAGLGLLGIEDSNVQIAATMSGIIGFAINYGCYMSEVIRSAIVAIDVGQREAGLALGFSETQVLFKFVLPPALRNSVPVFGNYLVMMVKDTSLLAMISVEELLLRTKAYASQTFLTVESYTLLAIVYLIISLPLSKIVELIERKLKMKTSR